MKCTNCDGTGKVVHPMMSMNGDEYTGEWEQHECEACNGTGEVEMTEQEYIQTCNTEQLAELLCDIRYDYQIPWKNKGVVEWLKQPHQSVTKCNE